MSPIQVSYYYKKPQLTGRCHLSKCLTVTGSLSWQGSILSPIEVSYYHRQLKLECYCCEIDPNVSLPHTVVIDRAMLLSLSNSLTPIDSLSWQGSVTYSSRDPSVLLLKQPTLTVLCRLSKCLTATSCLSWQVSISYPSVLLSAADCTSVSPIQDFLKMPSTKTAQFTEQNYHLKAQDKITLQTSPESLVKIQSIFTEMFLILPSAVKNRSASMNKNGRRS